MQKIMFNDQFCLTKAVLDRIKEMTRRLIKGEASVIAQELFEDGFPKLETEHFIEKYSRYKVGDVVAIAQCYKDIAASLCPFGASPHSIDPFRVSAGWKNKMFVRADYMPHQIKITDIRIERLQDISDDDCLKEGINVYSPCSECGAEIYVIWGIDEGECFDTPGEAYAALIDRISGKGTWDSNPWVFVYSFQLLK